MKHDSNFRTQRLLPLLLFSFGVATGTPARAQDAPAPTAIQVPAEAPPVILPRVSFAQARLGEVVDYISEKTQMNIVLSQDLRNLEVPDMELHNVTGVGILHAIANTGVPLQISEKPLMTPTEAPVWIVKGIFPVEKAPSITRIFNLRHAATEPAMAAQEQSPEIFKLLVDDLSEAIKTALLARAEAANQKTAAPVIKVHERTRLLIVSGGAEEVEIAHQVICALGGQPVDWKQWKSPNPNQTPTESRR